MCRKIVVRINLTMLICIVSADGNGKSQLNPTLSVYKTATVTPSMFGVPC
ncbi:hypothetical protein Pan258_45860 [Symmachiella dynata]|nr:hypothetical protein Pan258_45860 [Symmachiella dynata]